MSYTQENATIQQAIEALKAGAKAWHGGLEVGLAATICLRDCGGTLLVNELLLTGWRIEWPDAPECSECEHRVHSRCSRGHDLAIDGLQTNYCRADDQYCGPTGKWFEARAEKPDTPEYIYPGAVVRLRDGRKAYLDDPRRDDLSMTAFSYAVTGWVNGKRRSWNNAGLNIGPGESGIDIVGQWVDDHSGDANKKGT